MRGRGQGLVAPPRSGRPKRRGLCIALAALLIPVATTSIARQDALSLLPRSGDQGELAGGHYLAAVTRPMELASLEAADELLARTEHVVAERHRVRDALLDAGYDVPESGANFLWLPLGDRSAAFAEAAAEAGVILRNFTGDGTRVTIGDPHENDRFLAFATGPGRALAGLA